MIAGKFNRSKGISLIETMLAVTVLAIVVLGASSQRYHSILNSKKAGQQVAAARLGGLLTENWRGVQGDPNYDPITYFASQLTIVSATGPDMPDDFTLLSGSKITLGTTDYYATLSWQNIQTGLRALNVVVAWPQQNETVNSTNLTLALTTYSLTGN